MNLLECYQEHQGHEAARTRPNLAVPSAYNRIRAKNSEDDQPVMAGNWTRIGYSRPDVKAEIARIEAEKAEAARLRLEQRAHPLYHTRFQRDLLKYWKKNGKPPAIPPKALIGFTPWIMQHSDADEDDVRDQAAEMAKHKVQVIADRLGPFAAGYLVKKIQQK